MPIINDHPGTHSTSSEISRLLTAAVVNSRFCKLLLADPAKAVATGFNGERFCFAKEEFERIIAIQARSLADFASQLTPVRNPSYANTPNRVAAQTKVFATSGMD
jgi:hypothetical protein